MSRCEVKSYLVNYEYFCEGDGDKDGLGEEGSKEEKKVEREGEGGG